MTENLDYVQKGFRILLPMMAGCIYREMYRKYEKDWWNKVLECVGDTNRDLPQSGSGYELIDTLDINKCLRIIDRQWNEVFRGRLNRDCRSWVKELMGPRNTVAHAGSKDITQDYAERALDTMARLCNDFDTEDADKIRALLRELRYGSSQGSMAAVQTQPAPQPVKGKSEVGILTRVSGSKLPSWREIIEPHPDVAQGRYKNAEFAANLGEVAQGGGSLEYLDPVEFFARTYITEGIKGLLIQAVKRLNGKDGEPVLQLKTAFGGGKTHSLLALYHMAKGGLSPDKLPNLKAVLNEAGFEKLPNAKVAVIVGTAIDPTAKKRPAHLPGATVNTLWGDIASQLAFAANDPKLYDYVKEADKKGISPGSGALKELFDACGPCLILMDELVAYGRKIYGVSGLPAGSFENFISFVQEITEAAGASKNSLVVASIPESDIEIGDKGGRKVLEAIEHTFGRKESVWRPVNVNEGFEVVRRRLFLDCKNPEERDRVCSAFSRMYSDNQNDFPIDSKELDYKNRMISCYPIHPEIFDRLYGEWATMERFQRTRGVLRLMAAVIHNLWMAGDAGAMIMPGSLPLDISTVKDELVRYLPENWNAIIDSEVDGKNSAPYILDRNSPRFGQSMAARRMARTVMLGSAPTVRSQKIRGLEISRVRLGVIQPGESIADFNDALNTLRGKLSYLYSDPSGNRFWYDTRPTLAKTAQDRASQISEVDVDYELEKALRTLKKETPFERLHICPDSSSDVSDDPNVRLVILRPCDTYKNSSADCPALVKAGDILNNRGSSPRACRNMLVFLAPDQTLVSDLRKAAREQLAWESIKDDRDSLNLDSAQNRETDQNIANCKKAVSLRLNEVYRWLLVPEADKSGDTKTVSWTPNPLAGNDGIIAKAAKQLLSSEQVIVNFAPVSLKLELDGLLWRDASHIEVKRLWDYLTSYCYLPRLANFSVLEAAVRECVKQGDFLAIASSFDGERYVNLRRCCTVSAINPGDLLVKAETAAEQFEQIERERQAETARRERLSAAYLSDTDKGGPSAVSSVQAGIFAAVPQEEEKPRRFFMSARLDNTRIGKDLQKYLDEVITHLEDVDNCKVELTLEVNAQAEDGFPPDVVRAVSENCRTCNVDDFSFDK